VGTAEGTSDIPTTDASWLGTLEGKSEPGVVGTAEGVSDLTSTPSTVGVWEKESKTTVLGWLLLLLGDGLLGVGAMEGGCDASVLLV
jgi:hypothetical protein